MTSQATAQVLDTLCVVGNPSHLAVDYHPGSTYWWGIDGGTILSGAGTHDVLVQWGPTPGLHLVRSAEMMAGGCWSDTAEAYVYLRLPDQALIQGPVQVCRGQNVSLVANSGHELLWNGSIKQSVLNFTADHDTTVYLVAYNGPCDNDTIWHTVEVVDAPVADFIASDDSIHRMEWVTFTYTGPPVTNLDWYVNNQWVGSGPELYYQFTENGEAAVRLEAENGGCTDSQVKNYLLEDKHLIAIPNAFTPDGDGLNDVFLFKADGILDFTAMVYNRWGGMIYSWSDYPENGWDGQDKGVDAPMGVYTYRIVIKDFQGYQHVYDGHVTLVR